MNHNRKGQLSIETMIIYGLVILVALSVIGGLLYFNILDVGSYLPDNCNVGGTDLECEEMALVADTNPDPAVNNGELRLGVRNIGQREIQSLNVSLRDQSGTELGTAEASDIGAGDNAGLTISNLDIENGDVLQGTLVTQYRFVDGAIEQQTTGDIRVRAS